MGVKNLFGCVFGKMKVWWYMEVGKDVNCFGEMLVEMVKAIVLDLSILDGIMVYEGNGFMYGDFREVGLLAVSFDVFVLDFVIIDIL